MNKQQFDEFIREYKRANPALANDPHIAQMLDGALYTIYGRTGNWQEVADSLNQNTEAVYRAVGLPLPSPAPEESERQAAEDFEAMRQRSSDVEFEQGLDIAAAIQQSRQRRGQSASAAASLAADEALQVYDPQLRRIVDVSDLNERAAQDAEAEQLEQSRMVTPHTRYGAYTAKEIEQMKREQWERQLSGS